MNKARARRLRRVTAAVATLTATISAVALAGASNASADTLSQTLSFDNTCQVSVPFPNLNAYAGDVVSITMEMPATFPAPGACGFQMEPAGPGTMTGWYLVGNPDTDLSLSNGLTVYGAIPNWTAVLDFLVGSVPITFISGTYDSTNSTLGQVGPTGSVTVLPGSRPVAGSPDWQQSVGRSRQQDDCPAGYHGSYAQWMNDGAGGWTCDRTLHYDQGSGTWVVI